MTRQFRPGQLQTGSLYNISSSYAVTASYALNSDGGAGFPFSGSAVITGSLLVSGSGITGSLFGTASFATTASYVNSLGSSNYSQSFSNSSTWTVTHNLGTRLVIIQAYDSGYDEIIPQNIDLTDDNTATITFPTLESGFAVASVGGALSSGNTYITNTGGDTGSFATTGSNSFKSSQIITGSLTVSAGLYTGDSNIYIDADDAFPFVVGYGLNSPLIKTNTVIGYFSLANNSSGGSNVSIGNATMQSNSTGHTNTAIGAGALGSNTVGFRNTALGFQAAANADTYNSVAIGHQSLINGGSNNTAVGYSAGKNATNISHRNIYLGYDAGPSSSTTESDKLYISNASGTPLIAGDFAIKEVDINGTLVTSGSLIVTGSLDITGSATLNNSNIISSNTIMKIETISSASYAALTPPVSGTLYIII
jgi:hypothetical protein